MDIALYLLAALLIVGGLAGAVLPTLPGIPMLFGGIWLVAAVDHYRHLGLGWLLLGALGTLGTLGHAGGDRRLPRCHAGRAAQRRAPLPLLASQQASCIVSLPSAAGSTT